MDAGTHDRIVDGGKSPQAKVLLRSEKYNLGGISLEEL